MGTREPGIESRLTRTKDYLASDWQVLSVRTLLNEDVPWLIGRVRELEQERLNVTHEHTEEYDKALARIEELEAELYNQRRVWSDFTARIGYGDDFSGPAIDPDSLIEIWEQISDVTRDHDDGCPEWCDNCGYWERPRSCEPCYGSGCGPGTALGAYEECQYCAGDGRDHKEYTLTGEPHPAVQRVLELCALAEDSDDCSLSVYEIRRVLET